MEQQDALVWNGNLICQPIRPPALASKGPPESSVKAIEASAAFASLGEVSLGSYTEGDGKLELDDEEDDGIPAEDDKVIDDVGPGELQEASLESVAKPVEKSPTHISHHVQFATKAVSVEESQISVAPDWFSSLGVGEPPYTMATQKLQGCVDYIWFTPVRDCCMHCVGLLMYTSAECAQGAVVLSGVLSLPPRSAVEGLLPTREYSSDHIAILSEFRFEPSCLSADW